MAFRCSSGQDVLLWKNHRKARHCWSQTLEQCFSSSSTWMEGTFVCLCGRGSKQRWCVEEKQGLHPRSDGLHEWIKSWPASTVLPGRTSHGRNWWVWPCSVMERLCLRIFLKMLWSWLSNQEVHQRTRSNPCRMKSRCNPNAHQCLCQRETFRWCLHWPFFHMCTTRWREQRQWRWWTLRM